MSMSQMRLGSKSSDSFICILNDAYEVIKTDYTNIMKKIVISKKSKVIREIETNFEDVGTFL